MKSLKLLYSLSIVLFALFLFNSTPAYAQSDQSDQIVVQVDFFKSKPGGNYMSLEMDIYKAIHHEMINQGDKLGWYLYSVRFPFGSHVDYDFVTVNVYKNLKQAIGDPLFSFNDLAQEVHSNLATEDLLEMTEAARIFVKMELFTLINEAVTGTGNKPAEYVMVNFMDVREGMGEEYVEHELKWYRPQHLAAIAEGNRYDWSLYERSFPYGDSYGYNYLTIDFYKDLDQLAKPASAPLMEDIHKGSDTKNLFRDKTSKLRTLMRQETWQLIDYSKGSETN